MFCARSLRTAPPPTATAQLPIAGSIDGELPDGNGFHHAQIIKARSAFILPSPK